MMVSSNQQWCLMRWNQTTSVWSLGLMSPFPHLRPFLDMFAIFARLIAQFSSTTSTPNSPVSTTLPLNSATQLFSQCWTNTLLYLNIRCLWESTLPGSVWWVISCLQPRDIVDRQNNSGEPQALQFTNYTTKRNTMSQNWSKKQSLFFYSTNIAAVASSKELYSITNRLAARTKCSLLPTIFPQSDLPNIFSDFFLNKIVKIRNELGPQSPLPS